METGAEVSSRLYKELTDIQVYLLVYVVYGTKPCSFASLPCLHLDYCANIGTASNLAYLLCTYVF